MILAQRLYQARYLDDRDFEVTLDFLTNYKDCVDEVVLMAEYTMNAFYPIEQFRKLLPLFEDRIARFRERGFARVGINIVCTFGHHGEASRWPDDGRFQRMVNCDGAVADGCYCTNDPAFMRHVREKYAIAAEANPDFIWVDDDVRMHMHDKALFPCFCGHCMNVFNQTNGTDYTRDTLSAKLNQPQSAKERRQWVEQNVNTIDLLLQNIEQAVHQVNENIELGFMHCNDGMSTYTGAQYRKWLGSLKSHKTRPGGGLYTDRMPLSYIEKVTECARSGNRCGDIITDLQYEYEQFTYQKYLKSWHMANVECVSVFANGYNGIAFNAMKLEAKGNMEDWNGFMLNIRAHRAQWERMVEYSRGFHNEGVNPLLPINYEKYRTVDEKGWFVLPGKPGGYGDFSEILHLSHTATLRSYVYNEIGIPLTTEDGHQAATILEGKMAEGLTKGEAQKLFEGGVFLDAEALKCLENMGLGELCGVKSAASYVNNVVEEYTDDPINEGFAGEIRDARICLMRQICETLIVTGQNVRVINNLTDNEYKPLGPTFTLYENSLGGRVAVCAHSPYNLIFSSAKILQLRRVFEWLSGGNMPLVMEKANRVIPTIRVSEDRKRFLLCLVNGNFDEERDLTVAIRAGGVSPVCEVLADGTLAPLNPALCRATSDGVRLTLPALGMWEYKVIVG